MTSSRTRRRRAHRAIAFAPLLTLALACGCGSSGDDPAEDVPANRRTEQSDPVEVRDPPPCTELYAEGVRTNADDSATEDGAYCTDGGARQLVRSSVVRCPDGRTLVYNNWGWGFDGESWHAAPGTTTNPVSDQCPGNPDDPDDEE